LNRDVSDHVLGLFGKLLRRRSASAWFHNIWTCGAKVLVNVCFVLIVTNPQKKKKEKKKNTKKRKEKRTMLINSSPPQPSSSSFDICSSLST
jgi:hypothetical protein